MTPVSRCTNRLRLVVNSLGEVIVERVDGYSDRLLGSVNVCMAERAYDPHLAHEKGISTKERERRSKAAVEKAFHAELHSALNLSDAEWVAKI